LPISVTNNPYNKVSLPFLDIYAESVELLMSWKTGRWGDGEMGRRGDGEMGRRGDGEMGRRGDGETGRRGDGEMGRRGDGEMGRRGDGEMGKIANRLLILTLKSAITIYHNLPL
jgi:hypothetical protein